jgi:citrate lyase subunit beta/citryl-CoA lyase
VLAIVETARGVRLSYETAATQRVAGLILGGADLGAPLWVETRTDGHEILYARSKLVVDAADAGVRPPIDVVHLDVKDDEGLRAECRLARSLGMRGKACIHPGQVEIVNEAFAPTEDELGWAREVLEAMTEVARDGRGAVVVRGALVDRALVERAERILADVRGESSGS